VDGEPRLVPDALRRVVGNPADSAGFDDLWPYLCSEGTTWDAAYAATPYLVDIAGRVEPGVAAHYLTVVGLVVACGSPSDVPDDLRADYDRALAAALPLATARLADCPDDETLRYLLATVAALRGRDDLAEVLQNIETVSAECPECGGETWPDDLQAVTARDQGAEAG
jgi:hypothetical protein